MLIINISKCLHFGVLPAWGVSFALLEDFTPHSFLVLEIGSHSNFFISPLGLALMRKINLKKLKLAKTQSVVLDISYFLTWEFTHALFFFEINISLKDVPFLIFLSLTFLALNRQLTKPPPYFFPLLSFVCISDKQKIIFLFFFGIFPVD